MAIALVKWSLTWTGVVVVRLERRGKYKWHCLSRFYRNNTYCENGQWISCSLISDKLCSWKYQFLRKYFLGQTIWGSFKVSSSLGDQQCTLAIAWKLSFNKACLHLFKTYFLDNMCPYNSFYYFSKHNGMGDNSQLILLFKQPRIIAAFCCCFVMIRFGLFFCNQHDTTFLP